MSARKRTIALAPVRLPANLLPRFYRGGPAIGRFRGLDGVGDHQAEDWVGSTTTARGQAEVGLARLPDGRRVRDAVAEDPEGYLGADHVARFGADPGFLVKLLDAGERLPVHCHPTRAFAAAHAGSRFGKTEAWIVVETASRDACVHVGFREAVPEAALAAWIAEQRCADLLDALNRVPVAAGDAIFVPGGVPHSIGEGVLLVEVQEPTDLSVILEWEGYAIDAPQVGHMRLGYATAQRAVDRSAWDGDRLARLRAHPSSGARRGLLPEAAAAYFGAEAIRPGPEGVALEPSFAILVVTNGRGTLAADGLTAEVARGETWLVPYASGAVTLAGELEALRLLPPAADRKETE